MLTKKEIEKALLNEYSVEFKQFKKFAKLTREHLYGRDMIVKNDEKISPFLEQFIDDRVFLDLLKRLNIYDFQIKGYFEKVWSFRIVFNNRFSKDLEIAKHSFPEPLEYIYATAVALLYGLRANDEYMQEIENHQLQIEEFIEY